MPVFPLWTILKEHKCKENYLGKRKHCTAALQDMAFEVFRRAHLKGCHCRPACLLAGFSVWVLSTIVTYSGCTENLSQSSTQAGNTEPEGMAGNRKRLLLCGYACQEGCQTLLEIFFHCSLTIKSLHYTNKFTVILQAA